VGLGAGRLETAGLGSPLPGASLGSLWIRVDGVDRPPTRLDVEDAAAASFPETAGGASGPREGSPSRLDPAAETTGTGSGGALIAEALAGSAIAWFSPAFTPRVCAPRRK